MMKKVRPNAFLNWTDENDDRVIPIRCSKCTKKIIGSYYIEYSCPKCNNKINENDISCTECGTFFDWSKKAVYRTIHVIEWC